MFLISILPRINTLRRAFAEKRLRKRIFALYGMNSSQDREETSQVSGTPVVRRVTELHEHPSCAGTMWQSPPLGFQQLMHSARWLSRRL